MEEFYCRGRQVQPGSKTRHLDRRSAAARSAASAAFGVPSGNATWAKQVVNLAATCSASNPMADAYSRTQARL